MNPHDEGAFRVFVDTRSRALLHTARLLTGDPHAAEDLVQEALARLVPRWGRVDNPEAYTRVTMHRLQISRWRRRAVIAEDVAGGHLLGAASTARAGDHSEAVQDRVVLARALGRLTPRQRSVLVCRHIEDLDERETADRLGIRVGSVRSINRRALDRLLALNPELADFRTGRSNPGPARPATGPSRPSTTPSRPSTTPSRPSTTPSRSTPGTEVPL